MTKRILALVMAVLFALTCSVMVACSNTTTAPEEEPSSPAESKPAESKSGEAPVVTPSNGETSEPATEPVVEPSTPVEPSSPEDDVTEPEMYTTEWLEWLTNVDMGEKYPMVYSGGLYGGMKYGPTEEDKANQSPSAFELWPYGTIGDLSTVGENAHFHMCLTMDSSEFDGTPGIGTEDYGYKWVVYYREMDSTGDYAKFEGAPWGAITYGDNYLYRFDVYSAGFNPSLKDGGTNTYHMIFMIFDTNDELVIWRDEMVDWTDASELFLADAIAAGKVTKH